MKRVRNTIETNSFGAGIREKIAQLCGPLRNSAFSALKKLLTQSAQRIRRRPQRRPAGANLPGDAARVACRPPPKERRETALIEITPQPRNYSREVSRR